MIKIQEELQQLKQGFEALQKEMKEAMIVSQKEVVNVKELSFLTGLSVGTIYNLVSAKKIPHYKSDGGRLTFFKRKEIENYLCSVRVSTYKEMEQTAIANSLEERRSK